MDYSHRLTRFFVNTVATKTPVRSYLMPYSRQMSTAGKKDVFSLVPVFEARRFMEDCLIAVGTCKRYAEEMADVLVAADSRGHYSHGMNRLEMYIKDIDEGRLSPNEYPTVLKDHFSSAWVDGNNGLGAVVGNFCMKLAVEKACSSGIGWVVAKGSNHFGINSYYSMQALKSGMVGMTFTNTFPAMSPTRAKQPTLGTNPLSISAPGLDGESVILDMATTSAAVGKIELHRRKGKPIPKAWALGPDGEVTTDPKVAAETSALLPLGGLEETAGYKGYGLALGVEILTGMMAGSAYGPYINRWNVPTRKPANLGQCFVAINPECFAPNFEDRITDITSQLRNLPPVKEELPVLIAGDKEKASMEKTKQLGGLIYIEDQMKTCSVVIRITDGGVSAVSMASLVSLTEARRFMVDCLMAVGTCRENAEAMADALVDADYRGHYSHGMNRLDIYISDINENRLSPNATPCILKETASTAWVDGQNGLGAVVGNFCMQLAIKKAKEVGIGWVVAKGSNHFGIAGHYPMKAVQEGILGMCVTNTAPIMSPTRAKEAALGTNPLSVAAPGLNDDSIMLDMATTAVALGKIEFQNRKGQPIPEGWAQGQDGNLTTDAATALQAMCLMPLGGAEMTSGYKGYGLALMVEMFSGLLAGSAYGPYIRKWRAPGNDPANLGQCFVAINPSCFAPGFQERVTDLTSHLRTMKPVSEDKPVLVPGDPEKAHMRKVDEEGGINYIENQMKTALQLANKLKVKPLGLPCKVCYQK